MGEARGHEGDSLGILRQKKIRRGLGLLPEGLHTSSTDLLPTIDLDLQRNLVENGGILDEIIFVAKTDNEADLAYLEELLQTSDKYSAEYHNEKGLDFSQMYSACEKGNIYVKIDDDVVNSYILPPAFVGG